MKNNIIILDQAFYGNDQMGYRVLGASAKVILHEVEVICSEVGTPDGFAEVKPFLLSVPRGGKLYMICGQAGKLDASGRKTLFFHALIADAKQADAMNINAFSLNDAGYFKSNIPPETVSTISIASPLAWQKQVAACPIAWSGNRIAIISKNAENLLLRGILGNNVNTSYWASFSFQPLNESLIYVISEFAILPTDRNCYAPDGRLISKVETTQGETPVFKHASKSPSTHYLYMFLIISIIVNILLSYLLITKKSDKDLKLSVQTISSVSDKTVTKLPQPSLTREKVIESFRPYFTQKDKIDDLYRDASKIGLLGKIVRNKERFETEHIFLQKVKKYIDFVNNKIINQGKTENE
jgi:hypothetical protein